MYFISTRGNERVTGAEAVVQGLAKDGGLFVPEKFPTVSAEEMERMLAMDYPERAALVLSKYFDEYDKDELLSALKAAYAQFDDGDAAPLVKVENGMFMLELYHGPTCAFKDSSSRRAAIRARRRSKASATERASRSWSSIPTTASPRCRSCRCARRTGRTSTSWRSRATSTTDCQTTVKRIFHSEECKEELAKRNIRLSSANSINFGRLAPQIAYYFSAYLDLVSSEQIKMGDKVDFTVPTGNFGNILAAYYAKQMGLPVGRLVCASNRNNVLTDFLLRGVYDVSKRPFFKTMSPSMDILISSNLERLLFELSGRDAALTAERMESLVKTGKYSVRAEELKSIREQFYAGYASEDDTVDCVYEFFTEYGYPMDPHTGVAMFVAERYHESLEKETPPVTPSPMVVVSTASPYKFPQAVYYALTGNDVKDSFKGIKRINLLTAMKVPESLKEIRYKPIRFKTSVSADKIFEEVLKFVG